MRKKGQASVREQGGVVCPVRGWGERRPRLTRDTSLPLMQLKTQEDEAGRLPQMKSSCHSTAPLTPTPAMEGLKGKGASRKDGAGGI